MNSWQPIHGLVAAPFTPFHPNGNLNPSVIPAYAQFLADNGVNAAFVCGTTGEGPSLTMDERVQVVEAWIGAHHGRLRVIAHVGHNSQAEAIRLAAHALRKGAHAVSVMAPNFFKPASVLDLVDWCAPIAAAAAPLPFYFYHIPSFTGVTFPMAEFLEVARDRIPTLAGIKFTHEDLADYEQCLKADDGHFDILFGRDELLLAALKIGARGAIGSTYNYAAPLYLRLIQSFEEGLLDQAAQLQQTAVRMIALCNDIGVSHLAASKTLMAGLGIDCGPVRSPLRQPTAEQGNQLRIKLDEVVFSTFACKPRA